MTDRLPTWKTYKLFIGGKFPRTESGRSTAISDAAGSTITHVCRGSRKDLRNAIEAAAGAQPKWAAANAYLRGQILYRIAEMAEGRAAELASAIAVETGRTQDDARAEVDRSIDRFISFAGWADKYAQMVGTHNPVTGPYYNFSVPEPTGVVGVVAPDEAPLLGLTTLLAPALCVGNASVVIAAESGRIVSSVFAEVIATSDVPGGVVNILTGERDELLPHLASHRELNAILAAGVSSDHATTLRSGAAENLKRVSIVDAGEHGWAGDRHEGPWVFDAVTETKTIWHPVSS